MIDKPWLLRIRNFATRAREYSSDRSGHEATAGNSPHVAILRLSVDCPGHASLRTDTYRGEAPSYGLYRTSGERNKAKGRSGVAKLEKTTVGWLSLERWTWKDQHTYMDHFSTMSSPTGASLS